MSTIAEEENRIKKDKSGARKTAANQPAARFWQTPLKTASSALRFFLVLKNSIVFSLAFVFLVLISSSFATKEVWADPPTCPGSESWRTPSIMSTSYLSTSYCCVNDFQLAGCTGSPATCGTGYYADSSYSECQPIEAGCVPSFCDCDKISTQNTSCDSSKECTISQRPFGTGVKFKCAPLRNPTPAPKTPSPEPPKAAPIQPVTKTGEGAVGGIPLPSSWLGSVGAGLLPTGDIDFVTGKVVPFVINILLFLTIILSLIFLLLGGISWSTSGGDKEGLAKAKATVTYAVIGLVLGVGSFIILKVLGYLLGVKLI